MRIKMLSLFLFVAFACSKTEETPTSTYEFKNQDVTGKINSVAWTYADGYADVSSSSSGSEPKVRVNLVLAQPKKACDIFMVTGNQVVFSLPAKAGLYKLSFNLNGGTGYTATLLENATIPNNLIASDGAIEILTLTSTEITGRMDARYDETSFVNGNFKVTICP
jgi:hypothetical protein